MRHLFRIIQRAVGLGSHQEYIPAVDTDPAVQLEIKCKIMSEQNQIPLDISLTKAKFVVFDLETTGLSPYNGDEIISVSAVTIENGQIQKDSFFDHLVNPHRTIPPTITELTGISSQMADSSPSILDVLNEFLSFTRGSILVAHHAEFDLGFINLKLKQSCNTRITNPVIDTLSLANAILTEEKRHSLDSLIQYYQISSAGRHTSLGDALITAEILLKMLKHFSSRGVKTIQDLNNYVYWKSHQSVL